MGYPTKLRTRAAHGPLLLPEEQQVMDALWGDYTDNPFDGIDDPDLEWWYKQFLFTPMPALYKTYVDHFTDRYWEDRDGNPVTKLKAQTFGVVLNRVFPNLPTLPTPRGVDQPIRSYRFISPTQRAHGVLGLAGPETLFSLPKLKTGKTRKQRRHDYALTILRHLQEAVYAPHLAEAYEQATAFGA